MPERNGEFDKGETKVGSGAPLVESSLIDSQNLSIITDPSPLETSLTVAPHNPGTSIPPLLKDNTLDRNATPGGATEISKTAGIVLTAPPEDRQSKQEKPLTVLALEATLCSFTAELIWLLVVGIHTPTPNMSQTARLTGVASLIFCIAFQLFITINICRRKEWSRLFCLRVTQIAFVSSVWGSLTAPIPQVGQGVFAEFVVPLAIIWLLLQTKSVKDWMRGSAAKID